MVKKEDTIMSLMLKIDIKVIRRLHSQSYLMHNIQTSPNPRNTIGTVDNLLHQQSLSLEIHGWCRNDHLNATEIMIRFFAFLSFQDRLLQMKGSSWNRRHPFFSKKWQGMTREIKDISSHVEKAWNQWFRLTDWWNDARSLEIIEDDFFSI